METSAIAAGTLTSANYSLTLEYDAMNRLKYNAAGGGNYVYPSDTAMPPHAATSTVSGGVTQYSASYDAVEDMVCRSPTSATTCSGSSPTGQQVTDDAERRLSHWQSDPRSTPTNSADYLYDGSGTRIEQVGRNANTGVLVSVIAPGRPARRG